MSFTKMSHYISKIRHLFYASYISIYIMNYHPLLIIHLPPFINHLKIPLKFYSNKN